VANIEQEYSTSAALTITIAALASDTSAPYAGRQATLVSNTTTRYEKVTIYYKIRQGTSPTGNRAVYFYLIRSDNDATTQHEDGGAGASDAAWTVPSNMVPVHVAPNAASPATGDDLEGSFVIYDPGPEWTIGIHHDTGVNLDADAGDHYIRWIGSNPEIQ
jgi:hypothetical protein